MVTNYHVFRGKDVAGFGVLTRDGRVAPVVEILAVDEAHDVLIFRVDAKKGSYKPLPLGNAQRVGGNAHIIAHPDSRFFTYTAGQKPDFTKGNTLFKCFSIWKLDLGMKSNFTWFH